MLRESITLKDLDDRRQDVRAWCFRCARGAVIDTIMWQRFEARGWAADLQQDASDAADQARKAARRSEAVCNEVVGAFRCP